MGRSGLLTVFLLALVAALVLLAVSRPRPPGGEPLDGRPRGRVGAARRGARGLDGRAPATGHDSPATEGGDGARQVQQMQRDMEAMQEVSRSVGR
jgi:hypothetical protein